MTAIIYVAAYVVAGLVFVVETSRRPPPEPPTVGTVVLGVLFWPLALAILAWLSFEEWRR